MVNGQLHFFCYKMYSFFVKLIFILCTICISFFLKLGTSIVMIVIHPVKTHKNPIYLCRLGDTKFFRLQSIVKATVSRVFEDLKFKISDDSGQN